MSATEKRYFLEVEQSVSGRSWMPRDLSPRNAEAISQKTGLPELLGRVLAARDVAAEGAEEFLQPSLRTLMPDPSSLQDMDKAASRIAQAIQDKEQIAVIGDYDVDGTTSSTLLLQFLNALGRSADIHIPDRLKEGYGPNREAISTTLGAFRAFKNPLSIIVELPAVTVESNVTRSMWTGGSSHSGIFLRI